MSWELGTAVAGWLNDTTRVTSRERRIPVAIVWATLARPVFGFATIGIGAAGGALTPSPAIGAGLGAALGGLRELAWPGGPVAAFAFVAAAAFLGSTMRAPLTENVLVIEFTNQGPALLVSTMLCEPGAVTVSYPLGRRG